jgi:predicted AlkP superfamily pyrophosphatase or phosphodiesterase
MKFFLILFFFFNISAYANNRKVLFWLSVDGFKFSYLEKSTTPVLQDLLTKSLYTKSLRPIFPSITFPSHTSLSTGVKVQDHGIPSNVFYDASTGETHQYPVNSSLLKAEPIWQTVKKGGLRVAVIDWPLSFNQTGEFKADYFGESFNLTLSDEERIDKALSIWQEDLNKGQHFDLIMAYVSGIDYAGHRYGPNDGNVMKAVENLDRLIGKILNKMKILSESNKSVDYYFLITSDHGMSQVKYGVNLNLMSSLPEDTRIKVVPGGAIAHIFINSLTKAEKNKWLRHLENQYSQFDYVTLYQKKNLPKKWGYNDENRVGDLVLVLDEGHCFVKNTKMVKVPIDEVGEPLGIHGFDPDRVKSMDGLMILWKYPQMRNPQEIRRIVKSLEIHPTVSKILHVKPSAKALMKALPELKN